MISDRLIGQEEQVGEGLDAPLSVAPKIMFADESHDSKRGHVGA